MKQLRPRQNVNRIGGWLYASQYKLERNLYVLHRVTGLSLLLVFLIYLVRITISGIQGQDTWTTTLLIVHNRWFGIVTAFFIIHALNGLRLGLQETGFVLGRPSPPAYPFLDAMRKKRIFTVVMLTVTLLLILFILFIFFVTGVW